MAVCYSDLMKLVRRFVTKMARPMRANMSCFRKIWNVSCLILKQQLPVCLPLVKWVLKKSIMARLPIRLMVIRLSAQLLEAFAFIDLRPVVEQRQLRGAVMQHAPCISLRRRQHIDFQRRELVGQPRQRLAPRGRQQFGRHRQRQPALEALVQRQCVRLQPAHLAEGVARFFARDAMAEGPFPEHYEPFESPIGHNPMHPNNPRAFNNPAARMFPNDRKKLGRKEEYPHVATSYRLTEHFHYWTKHARLNAIIQPEQFVEIGEELGKEIGVVHGDRVRVSSKRGYIVAKAVVTKRIKALIIDGKKTHQVGLPIHFGFKGLTKPGYLINTLTPTVGDAKDRKSVV